MLGTTISYYKERDVMFRPKVIGLITALLLGYGCSMSPADNTTGYSGVVEGVIRNSSGQPLSGAFVKLKNAERRLTFMVISQEKGHYMAKKLPAGAYILQGVGDGRRAPARKPSPVAAFPAMPLLGSSEAGETVRAG
jgi:hypothetical protein